MKSQDKEIIESYTNINIKLQQALSLLEQLNKRRDRIIAMAEKEMTPKVQELMEENLQEFETLSYYVDKLKTKAERLKKS